jgi:hypothetical protein
LIKPLLLPLLVILVLPTSDSVGDFIVHGGRLNHEVCNNDIKQDDYHCHRSNRNENSNNNKTVIHLNFPPNC